jgi:hypothetical protein
MDGDTQLMGLLSTALIAFASGGLACLVKIELNAVNLELKQSRYT